jgi:hypothetical protein
MTFSVVLCVLCGSLSTACGRKGPPLAPIVYLPRAVTELSAKRVENDVVLEFTVPDLNTDGSSPADLRRVEVYAHTGPLPAPTDFLKYGTLVTSVEIADPTKQKPPEPDNTAEETGGADAAGTTAPVAAKQDVRDVEDAESKLTEQGMHISVREPLTDKEKEIGPMPPAKPLPPPPPDAPVVEKVETPGTTNFELPPTRYYTVVGVSRSRGRRGPYAGPLRVPLVEPLLPPATVDVSYTETAVSLTWPAQPEDVPLPVPGTTVSDAGAAGAATPVATQAADTAPTTTAASPAAPESAAILLPPLDQETPGTVELYADVETEGTQDVMPPAPAATPGAKPSAAAAAAAAAAKAAGPPAPRYGYNVYEVTAGSASAPTSQTASASAPSSQTATADQSAGPSAPVKPLNAALLTSPVFSDPRVEFDIERCYTIRRVEMSGGVAIEGVGTPPVCVTPKDTFPPAAPRNVQAIAGGAGVSLLWEANTEPDFGGYLVLRGEAPGDKLSPLTPAPISDTSFNDTTVRRGRTYVYEVIAVDTQTPANRSAPSNRVEETIR